MRGSVGLALRSQTAPAPNAVQSVPSFTPSQLPCPAPPVPLPVVVPPVVVLVVGNPPVVALVVGNPPVVALLVGSPPVVVPPVVTPPVPAELPPVPASEGESSDPEQAMPTKPKIKAKVCSETGRTAPP